MLRMIKSPKQPLRLAVRDLSYLFFKNIIDRTVAFLGIVVFTPLIAVIVAIIYIDDKGSPFFKQYRVGRHQRLFRMIKFRSMKDDQVGVQRDGSVVSGESLSQAILRYRRTEGNDPRITRVGRLLRKTHIDEIPQLLNIARGEMSFVGPRPDVPAQEAEYSEEEWLSRHRVKPGLTGLSQVTLDLEPAKRIELDLYYTKNCGLVLDMRILIRTILKVIRANSL